jgi:hypothetical protein
MKPRRMNKGSVDALQSSKRLLKQANMIFEMPIAMLFLPANV